MDDRTPSWGIEPVPERLRVLGFVDLFLLWSSLSVSLLVIVAGAVLVDGDFGLGLSLRSALVAIVAAALVGNLLLGIAGAIGADARVPGMVAPPRAARTARLVPADLPQRRPEPRLVDLRAADHRDGGGRALRPGARLPRALALDAALRRDLGRARAARADRVRAPLRPQVRDLGRARLAPLPDLVGARPLEPGRVLARPRPRRLGVGRVRPRPREHHLVDAARRRLHALRPQPAQRVLGHRASATSSRRSGCSGSARSCCSRGTSATRPRSPRRSRRAAC